MRGSRKVALAPTRRSEVTRAPSMRISVRPRASPRTAGTAAWPSDTWLTPGDVLERLHQVGRLAHRDVAPAERWWCRRRAWTSMLGAEPETVTASLTSGATRDQSRSCSATSASTVTGLM